MNFVLYRTCSRPPKGHCRFGCGNAGGKRRLRCEGLTGPRIPGGFRKRRALRKSARRVTRPSGTRTGPGCLPLGMERREPLRVSAGRDKTEIAAHGAPVTGSLYIKLEENGAGAPCPFVLFFRASGRNKNDARLRARGASRCYVARAILESSRTRLPSTENLKGEMP